jgi:hypothetical protein
MNLLKRSSRVRIVLRNIYRAIKILQTNLALRQFALGTRLKCLSAVSCFAGHNCLFKTPVLPYQDVWTLIQWYLKIDKFILAEDQMADFSFEVSLRFPTVVIQVILINITYQDAVDDSRIFSFGVIV